jgi:hypothetical protein
MIGDGAVNLAEIRRRIRAAGADVRKVFGVSSFRCMTEK